jgi:hypothetical protein
MSEHVHISVRLMILSHHSSYAEVHKETVDYELGKTSD